MGEDPSTEKMAAPSEPSAEEQVALIFDTIDIDGRGTPPRCVPWFMCLCLIVHTNN